MALAAIGVAFAWVLLTLLLGFGFERRTGGRDG